MTNQVETPVVAVPEVPTIKLTHKQKLTKRYEDLIAQNAKITEEATRIVNELNSLQAIDELTVGSDVILNIGRGETAESVPATVMAVRVEDDGSRTFKVQYGTGFDTSMMVVKSGRISLPAATGQTLIRC